MARQTTRRATKKRKGPDYQAPGPNRHERRASVARARTGPERLRQEKIEDNREAMRDKKLARIKKDQEAAHTRAVERKTKKQNEN